MDMLAEWREGKEGVLLEGKRREEVAFIRGEISREFFLLTGRKDI